MTVQLALWSVCLPSYPREIEAQVVWEEKFFLGKLENFGPQMYRRKIDSFSSSLTKDYPLLGEIFLGIIFPWNNWSQEKIEFWILRFMLYSFFLFVFFGSVIDVDFWV